MYSEEAAKIMEQVEQVHQRFQSLHLVGVVEFSLGGEETLRAALELWYQRPRLRVEWRPFLVPPELKEDALREVVIVDVAYAYRLSGERWTKRPLGWYSPTLREVVGLPPSGAQYTVKEEGELLGRPVWVVKGKVDGAQATWYVDKATLTITKFQLEGGAEQLLGPTFSIKREITFDKVEPNAEVPDGVFDVPAGLPPDERPAGGVFADLFAVLRRRRLVSVSACPLCGHRVDKGVEP